MPSSLLRRIRWALSLSHFALATGTLAAQVVTVAGTVRNIDGPLAGATILVGSPPIASGTSDAAGRYRLTVAAARGDTVVIVARAIGYRPERRTVVLDAADLSTDFLLGLDLLRLDRIVVTGTADSLSTRKTPFAVSVVDAEQLRDVPGTTPLAALFGRVAGASVTAGTGGPGLAPALRLRGGTSLTGRQDPLVIVDGTISRLSLADIAADDIERIEVLKGAAASSLYGSDAANGVVQIFTRNGTQLPDGRTELTVRTEFGTSTLRRTIPNNTSHPFQLAPDGEFVLLDGNRVLKPDNISDNPYPRLVDQMAQVYRPGLFITNHVAVAQRRGGTALAASFQQTRDQGVLRLLDGYSRQNARVNLSMAVTPRLNLQTGMFFSTSHSDQPDASNVFFGLRMLEPNVDLTAPGPDGRPYNPRVQQSGRTNNVANPLYSAINQQDDADRERFTGFVRGTLRALDWLTLEANANYDTGNERLKFFTPLGFENSSGDPGDGTLSISERDIRAYNLGMAATATRRFGTTTSITRLAYVYEDQRSRSIGVDAVGFAVPRVPEFSGIARNPNTPVNPASATEPIRTRNVFLVSTLDLRDRLVLDALVRRDESSLFGAAQRGATYARASVAYLPREEVKVRLSQGTAGLRPVFDAQYEQFALVGGSPVKVTLGNPNLRPARSRETEAGVDLVLGRRVTLSYSYADRRTTDQILNVPISATTGFQNQWVNAGTLRARTHEALVGAVLMEQPGRTWELTLTGDRSRQRVEALAVAPFLIGPDPATRRTQIFRIAPGETFGVLYGTRWIRSPDQLATTLAAGALPGTADDYLRNAEGFYVRASQWRTPNEAPLRATDAQGSSIQRIGNVNPDFTLSASSQFRWGPLRLAAVITWVQGGDIYNYTRQWPFFDLRDPVFDQRGKPAEARKPVTYYTTFYNNNDASDYFVEDGSYLRLRELAISIELPPRARRALGLGDRTVRFGVVGRNLLTLTGYSGYDPDVSGPGGGNPFVYRVDYFTYPVFRTLSATVELRF